MFPELEPFVPSAVCLSCDGCCRFSAPDSPWRPHVTPSERDRLAASDPSAEVASASPGGCACLTTRPDGETHVCRFFRPADHMCRVYAQRPFECRLYPFLLARRGRDVDVCAHLNCPFVQDQLGRPAYEAYTAYLRRYFADPRVLAELKAVPELAGDYTASEVELLTVFKVGGF